MKKLLAFTVLYICTVCPAYGTDFKVGFFDLSEIITSCYAYKDNMARIKKNFSREHEHLKKQEQDLQKRYADFKNRAASLSSEERSALNLELMYASRTFDDKNTAFRRRRSAAENQARDEAGRVVALAVDTLGERENFMVIMETSAAGVMYIDKAIDITAAVLQEANRIWREKPRALAGEKPIREAAGL